VWQIREVHDVLSRNSQRGVQVVRTRHAITFLFDYPFRHVQIVLRCVPDCLTALPTETAG
jgi:hypothetical protein